MQLTKNFSMEEMSCRCGCSSLGKIDVAFMTKLQKVRDAYGKPMKVNSGYRCEAHNKRVGGAKYSNHVKGIAADIAMANSMDRHKLIRIATNIGLTVIVYKDFCHIDDRPNDPLFLLG